MNQNYRVGFACNDTCSGGSWQGVGGNGYFIQELLITLSGYYVDIEELPAWKRILFIYALFMMMLMFLLGAINNAWKCYKMSGKQAQLQKQQQMLWDAPISSSEEKRSLLGGGAGYSSIQSYEPVGGGKYNVDI